MAGKVSRLILSKLFNPLPRCCERVSTNHSAIPLLQRFSTIRDGPVKEEGRNDADLLLRNFESWFDGDETRNQNSKNPQEPIPNKPLRGEKQGNPSENIFLRNSKIGHDVDDDKSYTDLSTFKFDFGSNLKNDEKMNQSEVNSRFQFSERFISREKRDNQLEDKFKIGEEKRGNSHQNAPSVASDTTEDNAVSDSEAPPEDADEIFKNMKENGVLPNAVAMFDGFCKDGLVQEAMNLFALMREKRSIPEVVTYTAVVEGYCKAHKLDDAKRIFRKMQSNSVSPNAYSYGVLVRGLCKVKMLDDAVEFSVEMLEAGHVPNARTFARLVDGICKEKGLEEAKNVIGRLKEKGFSVDEKAVREYLEKKNLSPMAWKAIFGEKSS